MYRAPPSLPHYSAAGPDAGAAGGAVAASEVPPEARWEDRAELGQGGMGTVRLCWDRWLQREVAIKTPRTAEDAERLAREARVTAGLEHPGIVAIHDVHRVPGRPPGYVMPVVRGSSLADRLALARGRAERLRYLHPLRMACNAIAFAHSRGVVHRDLTAANILIGAFGEVQVIDWGLAVLLAESGPEPPPRAGTPGAMSPEQERGERLDARSDVWSLGRLLWRLAYEGAQPGEPPVPAELADIVAKATAAAPADRYPDAGALAADLDAYLEGRRVAAHSYGGLELLVRLGRAWRRPLAVAAVALVALVGTALAYHLRLRAEERRANQRLAHLLLSNARAAASPGEAAVLAANALARVPLPEARGVLATVGGRSHPGRAPLQEPGCEPADVAPDGSALCVEEAGVSLVAGGRVRWSIPATAARAAFLDGGALVAVFAQDTLQRHRAADGAPVGGPSPVLFRTGLVRAPDGAAVLAWNLARTELVDGRSARSLPVLCGHPDALDAVALAPGGRRWLQVCRSGTGWVGEGDVAPRAFPIPPASDGANTRAFAFLSPELLLAGDDTGTLRLLSPDGTAPGSRLTLEGRPLVQSLIPLAGGRRVVALLDGRPALILSVPDLVPVLPLPLRNVRGVRAVGERSFVTASRPVVRWELEDERPGRRDFGSGIVSVALSGDGRRLAVAHGAAVSLVDAATQRILETFRWQDGHVPSVDIGPDGGLVACGLGEDRPWRLAVGRPPEPVGPPVAFGPGRAVLSLGGGRVLGLDYSGVVRLFAPGAPPRVLVPTGVRSLAGNAERRLVVAHGSDGALLCADGTAREPSFEPCGRFAPGAAIALHEREPLLFAARHGGVDVARLEPGGRGARTLVRHLAEGADLVAVAAAGAWVAAGARDGSVTLWRAGEPAPWAIARNHERRTATLALGREGPVVSGGWDGRLVFLAPEHGLESAAVVEARWGLTLDDAARAVPRLR